ncbi:MAG: MOSC domain-containing protein [Blastocatellia bacterium]
MRLLSVNVGLPREVIWNGDTVTTAIFKDPIAGPVSLTKTNLDGDRQGDPRVHGAPNKTVCVYPSEHYPYWGEALPGTRLPWGAFGENFTTAGMMETETNIGDQFRIGSALVVVTQPRMPCHKLGVRFGRDDVIELYLKSGRVGFYLSVLEEGVVAAGDTIEPVSHDPAAVTVADITSLYASDRPDLELMKRAVGVEALPSGWRDKFLKQLGRVP